MSALTILPLRSFKKSYRINLFVISFSFEEICHVGFRRWQSFHALLLFKRSSVLLHSAFSETNCVLAVTHSHSFGILLLSSVFMCFCCIEVDAQTVWSRAELYHAVETWILWFYHEIVYFLNVGSMDFGSYWCFRRASCKSSWCHCIRSPSLNLESLFTSVWWVSL